VDEGAQWSMRRSSGSRGPRWARSLVQAAAFLDVQPSVIADRPTPTAGSAGAVGLPHSWRLPA
jgi:hypothetical protein